MTAVARSIAALVPLRHRGDATRHCCRPALKALIESRAASIEASKEPERVAANARDCVAVRVGRYQLIQKWLKDRKGRTAGIGDITHCRKVAVALARTGELMNDFDLAATPLFANMLTRGIE